MRYLIFFVMVFSCCFCNAKEKMDSVTLGSFADLHPRCLKANVVYEGCNLLLSSDGEYLFVQFNILHPAMQMRFLMQGLMLYVDPTGKKKEKYSVIFPSAKDVQELMEGGNLNPSNRQQREERPDISPLIANLQKCGVVCDIKGKGCPLRKDMFSISLNEERSVLSYSVLIPMNDMFKEKKISQVWSVGLYSEGGQRGNERPNMEDLPMGQYSEMKIEEDLSSRDDQEELRKIMSRDIESWTKFSLENICSLND